MYKKKIFLMFCMIFLIGISFVSAGFDTINNNYITYGGDKGLEIVANFNQNYQINQGAEVHIFVFNKSSGKIISYPDVTCNVELARPNGSILLEGTPTTHENHFLMQRNASIITEAGTYAITVVCNSTDLAGYTTSFFDATESGINMDQSRSTLTIGLLVLLVFLLFISLYAMFNVENYIGKFALYWISHVLMILISFVGWQIGVEGLLGGVALTGIFRIMFWIFTISVLPMVILSGAWIFYIHTFNEHFEKLVKKGNDTETAFKMANKKSGGWFNGR